MDSLLSWWLIAGCPAGQDVLLCGFTSVLYAGMICASQILHRNLLSDFEKIRKAIREEQSSKKAD